MIRWFYIAEFERGLLFRRKNFVSVLKPGRHVFFDPLRRLSLEIFDVTQASLTHRYLDVLMRSPALKDEVQAVDLTDHQRALVWVDGRLSAILGPGLHAFWKVLKDVRIEVIDASPVRFSHKDLASINALPQAWLLLEMVDVDADHRGLFYLNGALVETLRPGRHAFWKNEGRVSVPQVDLREQTLDVGGQDIMTSDKVTLRLNAVLTYKVSEVEKSVSTVGDFHQALYREAQLALRAVIGTKSLDALLDEKETLTDELSKLVEPRAKELGLSLVSVGIRDVILPGEMKELLNKVTEAKKAAEANLITRREETAAVRSQANVAKLLELNPTLMRLRELEVLEKVTEKAQLSVVLGDQGLTDKVVKLL